MGIFFILAGCLRVVVYFHLIQAKAGCMYLTWASAIDFLLFVSVTTVGCCLLVGFINLKPDASCVFVLKKHVRMLLEKLVKLCETKSAKKIDDYMCNANFC